MPNSEEKAKRIAVGATIAGVLVAVFLIIVMIYGFIRIGVLSSHAGKKFCILQFGIVFGTACAGIRLQVSGG